MAEAALAAGSPFAMAFVDMRMPPGWDGMRTAVTLRTQDPSIYIVIATAFSDYDVNELQEVLGHDVVMLSKPFNQEEVFQLARTLCQSWETRHRLETVTAELESRVLARTAELDRRVAQQQALAEIATRFIELEGEDTIDDAIAWSLARIGRVIDADACTLFQFNPVAESFSISQEWVALGVPPLKGRLRGLSRTDIRSAYARFLRGESFSFNHPRDIPAEMTGLREALAGHIESCLAVPMEIGGELAGFLTIGFVHAKNDWDAHHEPLLRTAGHVIARAMQAHEAGMRIRESRELLSATEHAAHIGNWRLDAETLRGFWDDEIRRIVGVGPEQEAGPAFLSTLVHPEDWPAVESSLMSSLRQGTHHHQEYRIRRPDGEERWVSCWAQPQRDGGGRVLSLVGMLQDITERRRASDALIQAERRWREILVNLPQIGVSMDPRARIVFANQYFLRLTGWEEQEVLGRNWFDLFIPEAVRDTVRQVFDTVMHAGDTLGFYTYENEIVTRSGEPRNVAWSNVLTKDAQGNVLDVTCIGTDLTERKRAENLLRQSEARFRKILDQVPTIAVQGYAPDGTVRFWNQASERLYGFTREEALGANLLDLIIPPAMRDAVRRAVLDMTAAGQGFRAEELVLMHRDGSEVPVYSSHVVIANDGEEPHLYCLDVDIAERRRLEAELREAERSRETLLANLPGMAYRCLADENWTLLYVSTGVLELTGYSREDMVGEGRKLHYAEIIHPGDRAEVARLVAEALRNLRPFELQYRIVRADGTVQRVWERGRQTSPSGREPVVLEGFIAYTPNPKPLST
jgi:PAS domain S-box-containing protein